MALLTLLLLAEMPRLKERTSRVWRRGGDDDDDDEEDEEAVSLVSYRIVSSILPPLALESIANPPFGVSTMSQHHASTTTDNTPYSRPQTPHPQHQVGWVGTGNMGYYMAKNLAVTLSNKQPPLPPLLVYNRTSSKAEKLQDEVGKDKVHVVKDLVDLGSRCDVIFTSLSSDAAAEDVYSQLLRGQESRRSHGHDAASAGESNKIVFVDTSTLYPATTGDLERRISSVPHRVFIAAPAFGPPPMAQAGTLVFAVAGPHASKKFISQFIVPGVGRKIMDFGSNPERAASFKLIGNSFILGQIEILAETMTLAEKTGVGSDRFYEFIQEFFPAPSAIGYGKKILEHQFNSEEGFSLDGGIKDASHIRRLATSVDCPVPTVDNAHRNLVAARANSRGRDLDWSSLVAGQRISSGLSPFEKSDKGLQKEVRK